MQKIRSFINDCTEYEKEIEDFCNKKHHLYNEDVFWALVPKRFKYPDYKKALQFSIDLKPEHSMSLNDNNFPFACHGLTNPKFFNFWNKLIDMPG